MKAINEKELRLGNLILGVYYTEDDEGEEIEHDDICEVLAINNGNHFANYSIYVDSESDTEIFSSFHPIPLTEEWLVKLGFEKKGRFYRMGALTIEILVDCFRVCLSGSFISNVLFVHSLQNLYFCLSNKELSYEYK